MIYLFCSASRPLYKRDALECTCYPSGHLFRFRYEKTYIDPAIWDKPESFRGKEGLIVFIDTVGEEGHKDFDFLPIRKIKTVRLFPKGLAIYIDFKFGDFINYGPENDETQRISWRQFFESLPNRPWPPAEKSGRKKEDSEGYFAMSKPLDNPEFPTKCKTAFEAWETLIRRLNKTNDLKDGTFFQILGFYMIKRILTIPGVDLTMPFPALGRLSEVPLRSKDNSYDSIYPLPMGKSVVLKLLFSRPTYDSHIGDSRRALEVKAGTEAFAGLSKNIIYSESRYNEERIVLVCKRVFDSFLSPVSIEQQNEPSNIQSPKPFLLTRIKVPKRIVSWIIGGVMLSTFLVGFDADMVNLFGGWIFPNSTKFIMVNAKTLSAIAKFLATIPIGLSAFYAFRRLPLK
jgi:hypothetical protein